MTTVFNSPPTLAMAALRIVTLMSLWGRTWAMDRIYDSPGEPADIRSEEKDQAHIAIYVDDATDGLMTLILEVTVTSPQVVSDGEGVISATPGVAQVNATDDALEFQLSLLCRQAVDALMSTEPTNVWPALWRELVIENPKTDVRRGGPGQDERKPSQRYASRLLFFHVRLLDEPPRGADMDDYPVWAKFLAACDADGIYAGVAKLMRAHIQKPGGALPEWRLAQKDLALTEFGARSIGIDPVEGFDQVQPGPDDPAAPVNKITPVQTPFPTEPVDPMERMWRDLEEGIGG